VAIKCVQRSKLTRQESDNLVTEISLLKKLRHENIVQMIDFGLDQHHIYIVMEYCGGGDLASLIRARQKLSEQDCKPFLQQLALALKYLHAQGVAHLDLKPSNILLTSGKRPVLKLADFGLAFRLPGAAAVAVDDGQRDGDAHSGVGVISGVRGSYLYMAPEILKSRKYDARVDLWSVGVIFFECLFGRAPFKSDTLEGVILKATEDAPVAIPRAGLSAECRDLLGRCLRRNPDERVTFEEFFAHHFLDLEHAPSSESEAKARTAAARASREDKAGEHQCALVSYREALEYVVPLHQAERSTVRREELRKWAESMATRAEELKTELAPTATSTLAKKGTRAEERTSGEATRLDQLVQLAKSTPKLATGLDVARVAERYELEGQYKVS